MRLKKQKTVIIISTLMIVSCATHKNTYDSELRVREGNVNLYSYVPFAKKTQTVFLDTVSTLKLETDLPLLNGATALYPVYSAFAQAVYPKKKYDWYSGEVACNNTIGAYEKLVNKTADIIFVAPPSKKQLEAAENAGVSFRYIPIGKEAFVFFVNSQNPVSDLTIEQLQAIYSGEITNWKDLGGNYEVIRPFQRNENSGSQTAFVHFMQEKTIMEPPTENVHYIMEPIVTQTADYTNYGNAIGFSFRFYVKEMVKNEKVKILKINGVYPNLETIGNGTYPLSSSFFAVTLTDNNKLNVTKFLDWIVSEQGQYLVKKTGYCPIK